MGQLRRARSLCDTDERLSINTKINSTERELWRYHRSLNGKGKLSLHVMFSLSPSGLLGPPFVSVDRSSSTQSRLLNRKEEKNNRRSDQFNN